MQTIVRLIDRFLRQGLANLCSVLLMLMVAFTCFGLYLLSVANA